MGRRGTGPMGMMGGGRMHPAAAGPVPVLPGQHAPYLIGQLNRFANDAISAGPTVQHPPYMAASERAAVAAYLSATSPGYE